MAEPMQAIGIFTTDAALIVRTWDAVVGAGHGHFGGCSPDPAVDAARA